MPTITIERLPATLHRELLRRARSNGRTLEAEIVACLQQVLGGGPPVGVSRLLSEAAQRRRLVKGSVSDAEISAAKRQGRR